MAWSGSSDEGVVVEGGLSCALVRCCENEDRSICKQGLAAFVRDRDHLGLGFFLLFCPPIL